MRQIRLGYRFVLAMKNKAFEEEVLESPYVVQRYFDQQENMLVHNTTTVSQQEIMVLVSSATIFGFELWCQDMA